MGHAPWFQRFVFSGQYFHVDRVLAAVILDATNNAFAKTVTFRRLFTAGANLCADFSDFGARRLDGHAT